MPYVKAPMIDLLFHGWRSGVHWRFLFVFVTLLSVNSTAAKTCKSMESCEEAVVAWCSGDSRKDGDGDGIPCENICSSKRQVDQIRSEIGC